MNLSNHFLVNVPDNTKNINSSSVIYIPQHQQFNGSIGVIINRPTGMILKKAFKKVNFKNYNPKWGNSNLFYGGPINPNYGFFLQPQNISTNQNVYMLSNSKDILDEMSNTCVDLFVALGYFCWNDEQLLQELHSNWLVVKAVKELIFDVDPANRYYEALKLLGIKKTNYLYHESNFPT